MQQSIHDTDMAYIDTCTIVIDIFYSSFVAGIDLPHQGVVDSYNLTILGFRCIWHVKLDGALVVSWYFQTGDVTFTRAIETDLMIGYPQDSIF